MKISEIVRATVENLKFNSGKYFSDIDWEVFEEGMFNLRLSKNISKEKNLNTALAVHFGLTPEKMPDNCNVRRFVSYNKSTYYIVIYGKNSEHMINKILLTLVNGKNIPESEFKFTAADIESRYGKIPV